MSGLVLAIDTTHEFGSAAVLDKGKILQEMLLHSPHGFAHTIFGSVEQLLERQGVRLSQVDCFAAASGPGSFTGVRVGLACIKGLAVATGKNAAGVSNLEALAAFGNSPLRAVLLDARRGEVYGAVYGPEGQVIIPESVGTLAAWLAKVPTGEIEFIGPDLAPFAGMLAGRKLTHAPRALAAAVGAIAYRRWQAGLAQDPAALDANYVRRSDAELFWKG